MAFSILMYELNVYHVYCVVERIDLNLQHVKIMKISYNKIELHT